MNDVGILLRGKSLERLALIYHKFDDCYLVNDSGKELNLFGQYLKGKNIVHFVNSGSRSTLIDKKQYKEYGIDTAQFSFTKGMVTGTKIDKLTNFYASFGVSKTGYIPEKHRKMVESIKNTGVCCIFYVSKIIRPKRIWIAGLDFYHENYLVKENKPHHLPKSKKIDLTGSFVKIVRNYPDIEYNLVTYYKELPKINNLTVLEV